MEITADMKKTVNKKIFRMIVPITMENVLQMCAGLVTMGMIGHINALSVSAVGLSARVINLIWAFFKGIAVATTVFTAQYYGADERDKMKMMIHQSILSVIILASVLVLLAYTFPELILSFFEPDPELMDLAVEYLTTVIWGLPFFMVLIVINASFQGTGNTKTPLMLTAIMNIVNITVGYSLIFGVFGEPMGVRGAAVGSAVSQMVACAVGLYLMLTDYKFLREYRNKSFFVLRPKKMLELYKVGIPSGMELVFWQIATIILTKAILTFGATAYAAHQLGLQAESVSYMPSQGFGIASTALIGQCLGAGDKKMAKVYFKSIMKWGVIVALFGALLLLLLPTQLMTLLTNDSEIIELGAIYLMLMGICQMPQNVEKILTGAMRGAGYTKVPMYVAAVGLWGIRIPFSLISTYVLHYGIIQMWIIIAIDAIVRFCISTTVYLKSNIYEKNKLNI